MGLSAILFFISIAAFAFSKYAGFKGDQIMVAEHITMEEQQIADLHLYIGQSVQLAIGVKDEITISVNDKQGKSVQIYSYISSSTYDVLRRKPICAEIYDINATVITVEIKFKEAL